MHTPSSTSTTSRTAAEVDLDGSWQSHSENNVLRWCKHLPGDVVRHVPLDLVDDLLGAAKPLVESIDFTSENSEYVIRYRLALRRMSWQALLDLCPEGSAQDWQIATIGLQLARSLQVLHEAELPQVVVHPGRVGLMDGRLVLIPTAASTLLPFSRLASPSFRQITDFLAPEVLRTRAFVIEMLYSADVYSLGRLLTHLLARTPIPPTGDLALRGFEELVEGMAAAQTQALPKESRVGSLLARMCAAEPEQRPGLLEVIRELGLLAIEQSPQRTVERFNAQVWLERNPLSIEQFSAAEAARDTLQKARSEGLLVVSEHQVKLLDIDLMLLRQPPEAGRAIPALEQLRLSGEIMAEIPLRLGRAYWVFTGAVDHRERSMEEYAIAAAFVGWSGHVVEEWVRVLSDTSDPALCLRSTNLVPFDHRPLSMVKHRLRWWIESGQVTGAWHEVAVVLAQIPFDVELFDAARQVARVMPKSALMDWMGEHRQGVGLAAPRALVWEILGNQEQATRLLAEAQSYQPTPRAKLC